MTEIEITGLDPQIVVILDGVPVSDNLPSKPQEPEKSIIRQIAEAIED